MMEVKNVSFSYGRTPCLSSVDLCFEPGKLYAVIGPNGSGKTTLIRLLSGLAKPKTGSLLLDGKAYSDFGRKEFARKTALLPQGRNTPNTSVFDLVACGRYPWLDLSKRLTEEDINVVQSALTVTDTARFADRNVKTLSGGQRQRVYMAMLYAQDTPYVLLDEPSTHLDIAGGFDIMEQLVQMKQSGKCVITVLHDLNMAMKYADALILMHHGEAVLFSGPETLIQSGLLEVAFRVKCTPVYLDGETEYVFSRI